MRPSEPLPILRGVPLRKLVVACCARRAEVLVTSTNLGRSYHARMVDTTPRGFAVSIHSPSRVLTLRRRAQVSVMFGDARRSHVALTNVADVEWSRRETAKVWFHWPDVMVQADSRASYRVPVDPRSGLQLTLSSAEIGTRQAKALDLSRSGAGFVLDQADAPAVPVGQDLFVEIAQGDARFSIEAEVRRRWIQDGGMHYGVMYPEAAGARGPGVPSSLSTILRRLERRWLQRRAN